MTISISPDPDAAFGETYDPILREDGSGTDDVVDDLNVTQGGIHSQEEFSWTGKIIGCWCFSPVCLHLQIQCNILNHPTPSVYISPLILQENVARF